MGHEWTTVSGGPFSVLNFTGSAVRYVNDEGTGQAEVYIEPLFGAWYGWDMSDKQSSTTSTSWQNKASYTTPSTVPAGWYRIGYSFEWRRNSTGSDFKARLQISNSSTVMELSEESQDSNSWHSAGGFYIVQLSEGNHTIDLDYCGESPKYSSYIRRARLEFWMINDV